MSSLIRCVHLQVSWGSRYYSDVSPGGDQDATADCHGSECDENVASQLSLGTEYYLGHLPNGIRVHYHDFNTHDVP